MMIIGDIHEFIFIHIPKCAGTSVRSALFQHETRNNYYWYHHQIPGARDEDPKPLIDKAHMPLAIMKRFFLVNLVFYSNIQHLLHHAIHGDE